MNNSISHSHRAHGPSPSEVANAIAMAKQASANVLIAQQQVQAAKDNVLQQQRLATDKETHATILTQKSEAAAAIQRSEAAAAAQSVILAQQRLAAAKSMVAQQQRIAAAKEAQAATALHNSAHAAAVEIQRTGTYTLTFINVSNTIPTRSILNRARGRPPGVRAPQRLGSRPAPFVRHQRRGPRTAARRQQSRAQLSPAISAPVGRLVAAFRGRPPSILAAGVCTVRGGAVGWRRRWQRLAHLRVGQVRLQPVGLRPGAAFMMGHHRFDYVAMHRNRSVSANRMRMIDINYYASVITFSS